MSTNISSLKPADENMLEDVEIEEEQFFVNETVLEGQTEIDESNKNEINDATSIMENIIYIYDSSDEEDVPVIKSEDVDVVEQFVNEKGIYKRETFLKTNEDDQTNHTSCKNAKDDQQESIIHVYNSSDRENCSVIECEDEDTSEPFFKTKEDNQTNYANRKSKKDDQQESIMRVYYCNNEENYSVIKGEYVDTTEQFVDEKGIYDRETFLNTNKDNKTNNASCKRKKDDQQESIIHIHDSSDEENCSVIECEDADTTEQFVDEEGIQDKEAFLNQNQDNQTPHSRSIFKNTSEQDILNLSFQETNFIDQSCSMSKYSARKHTNSARDVRENFIENLYEDRNKDPALLIPSYRYTGGNVRKDNKCNICGFHIRSVNRLIQHMEEVHLKLGKDQRTLSRPKQTMDDIRKQRTLHLKSKRYQQRYQCRLCDFRSSLKTDMNNHLYLVHFFKDSEPTPE